jgi:uncharacterized protein YyaL (SSP411 family)
LHRLFRDDDTGGFYTTGSDADELIVRPQDYFDNATPSANSLAADALLRLAALTGNEAQAAGTRQLLEQLADVAARHSGSFAYLLGAYERATTAPIEIALVGDDPALAHQVHARLIPASVAVHAAPGTGADLTPLLADRPLVDGRPAAYVCERFACRRPVTEPDELRAEIDAALAARA